MLNNARSKSKAKSLRYDGCPCHNTKNARRTVNKGIKASDNRSWKKEFDKAYLNRLR